MGIIHFLQQFIAAPARTGAIAPSSRFLAGEIVRDLDLAGSTAVLEYGPGTGAFTPFIASAVPSSCKFVAIEVNPRFVEKFRSKFPGITLHDGSVAEARRICNEHGIAAVDCIVSGLPWAAFSERTQRIILDEMMRVLKPGGRFATFAYLHGVALPAGRRFAQILPKYFSEVKPSRIVWANLPPAFVYRCRR